MFDKSDTCIAAGGWIITKSSQVFTLSPAPTVYPERQFVVMQKSRRSHHFMQAVDSNVASANAAR